MTFKREFNCKLAHESAIKKLSGFNSIKELFERVSQTFLVPINEILYCTLNTHDSQDMDSLLANYLSVDDLLVVHVCGKSRDLRITKTQEYLGLTITDNGHGKAFVKKIQAGRNSASAQIKAGDHIAAINSESTAGMRHFEVARALREMPQNVTFTLRLIEPKQVDNGQATSNLTNLDASQCEDLINSSLPIDRLLSKNISQQTDLVISTHEQSPECSNLYKQKISNINSILESFLGINDNLLAIKIYRLAKESRDLHTFAEAVGNSELDVFKFGSDITNVLWQSTLDV